MSSNHRRRAVVLLAVVFGLAAGMLAGHRDQDRVSAITYDFYAWVHPGAQSHLNCGYHTVCSGSANWGTALDWHNSQNDPVYYRSYSDNSAGYSWSASGLITGWSESQCYFTFASLYKRTGAHFATIGYTYTGSANWGNNFTVWSGFYPAWTSTQVGYTVSEPTSCDTTGAHLHQYTNYGGNHWVNSYYPTMSQCSGSCGNKPIFDQYQAGHYWTGN
jgi:hypothetical protein